MQVALQVTGSLMITIVIFWLSGCAFFRFFQDAPMGFHTRPPGPAYDRSIKAQLEGQRRFTERWIGLWPVAIGMVIVGAVLIAAGYA